MQPNKNPSKQNEQNQLPQQKATKQKKKAT